MKLLVVLSLLLSVALSVRAAAVPVEEENKAQLPVEDVLNLEESVQVEEEKVEDQMEVEMFPGVRDTVPAMDLAALNPQARFGGYCPDGWVRYQSRCFLFVNSAMSWYNAEDYCNVRHASLISVHNPMEYSFLQQQMTMIGWTQAWLGGFNLQSHWRWIDHAGLYWTNWHSISSVTQYPCMFMRHNLGWGNIACTTSVRFICGRNPSTC